jgi:ribosome-associated protein
VGLTAEPIEVPIRDESIRLGQLLKLAGVVEDGTMARMVIEDGEVTVDGDVEGRRGRKIRPGMTVGYAGRLIRVTASG